MIVIILAVISIIFFFIPTIHQLIKGFIRRYNELDNFDEETEIPEEIKLRKEKL